MGALHKLLYGFGFSQFGFRVLAEMDPGTPEWFEFVEKLMESKDLETRSLAIDQIRDEGFYSGSSEQGRILTIVLEFLTNGHAEEKAAALDFFVANQSRFTKDDAAVFSAVYAASRNPNKIVSEKADELMKAWGFDRDDIKSDKDLR